MNRKNQTHSASVGRRSYDQPNQSSSAVSESRGANNLRLEAETFKTPHVPGCYPKTPAAVLSNCINDSTESKDDSLANNASTVDATAYNELRLSYDQLASAVERSTAHNNQVQARNERRIQRLEAQVKLLTGVLDASSSSERTSLLRHSEPNRSETRQRSNDFKNMAAAQPSSTPFNPIGKSYEAQKPRSIDSKAKSKEETQPSVNMNQFLSELRSVKLKKVGLPSKHATGKVPALSQSWHGIEKNCIFPSPPPSNQYLSRTSSANSTNDVFIDKPLSLFDEINGRFKTSKE